MSQMTASPQIDTTPPANWLPQPEAFPYVLDDTQTAPPVKNLYHPHQGPSERISTATYELGILVPIQVVAKTETGIGSKISLTVLPVGANIAIANSMEILSGLQKAPGPPFTSYIGGGFVIPAGTTCLQLATCDEIWAIALTTGALVASWISVLQEQFYGD